MDLREATVATINMGPAVDATDGVTPETALSPTVKLSKNGGTLAARNSATAITHDADGYYKVELNATDTNTRGRLLATMTDAATHVPIWEPFDVLAADVYDEKYGAQFALQAAAATTATLDAGAAAVDDYHNGQFLTITSGTGAGQTRRIIDYVGATKVATVDTAWATTPAAGSTFRIVGSASVSLSALERDAVADAYLDRANAIETGLTPRQADRLIVSAAAGKISGASAGAGVVVIRNAVADSKDRISATNDLNGNRTAVTTDVT